MKVVIEVGPRSGSFGYEVSWEEHKGSQVDVIHSGGGFRDQLTAYRNALSWLLRTALADEMAQTSDSD